MTRSLRCSALWVAALLLPSPAMSEEGSNGALHDEAPFNWTGFYLGAHLGGLANLSDISDPLGGSLFGNPNRATGGFAGAQIGYNHQSGFIVYGLEADEHLLGAVRLVRQFELQGRHQRIRHADRPPRSGARARRPRPGLRQGRRRVVHGQP